MAGTAQAGGYNVRKPAGMAPTVYGPHFAHEVDGPPYLFPMKVMRASGGVQLSASPQLLTERLLCRCSARRLVSALLQLQSSREENNDW